MTTQALNWWLRWTNEWVARAVYPFDTAQRDRFEEALSHYRWASELLSDAALIRAHGANDAMGWVRQLDASTGIAPWAAPALFAALYVQGVARRSMQAPRMFQSAIEAWVEGNQELMRTLSAGAVNAFRR